MKNTHTDDFNVYFGKRIKAARENKKMSQHDVAPKAGISQAFLSYIERGERDLPLSLAIKLCEIVSLDIKDFMEDCLDKTKTTR